MGLCLRRKLHVSDYPRSPRGFEVDVSPDSKRRFSFCCSLCRRRRTPPSVRFLGRRVYLGASVVVAALMIQGETAKRVETLQDVLGVSARTVRRWLAWLRSLPLSPFWKVARGQLASPPNTSELPLSLVDLFEGEEADRLIALLRFLSPLSTEHAR
ncbi:MAG: hypothetical protein RL885_10785 [Planctomycetota bacterium]